MKTLEYYHMDPLAIVLNSHAIHLSHLLFPVKSSNYLHMNMLRDWLAETKVIGDFDSFYGHCLLLS